MTSSSSNTALFAQSFQIVSCPKCHADFRFYRSSSSHIDESGFEVYRIECINCAAPLSGIIDPADNRLLLSEQDAGFDRQD
jgi:hypothetical protein